MHCQLTVTTITLSVVYMKTKVNKNVTPKVYIVIMYPVCIFKLKLF